MAEDLAGYSPATGRASTDVTWIRATNGSELSVEVARLVYPSRSVFWRPGAVVLAPDDDPLDALALTPLVHFPNNAPMLLAPTGELPEQVSDEIRRLQPTGRGPRGSSLPAQVYVAGSFPAAVETALAGLGLRTLRVGGPDPVATGVAVAHLRGLLTGHKPQDVFIVPAGAVETWCFAGAYSAHQGVPILYVGRDQIPAATERYLRTAPGANHYILADEAQVSTAVESRLRTLTSGKVTRITGESPAAASVGFATFKQGHFGWGRTKPDGAAFTFAAVDQWQATASGALLAHMGKHTPILLVDSEVPDAVKKYLASVNPRETHPPTPPFMHGFIVDFQDRLPGSVHVELEERLIVSFGDWPPPAS